MSLVTRLIPCVLIALSLVGCAVFGFTDEDAPPPTVQPMPTPPVSQPIAQPITGQPVTAPAIGQPLPQAPAGAPAPGDDAWLDTLKNELSRIRAGEAVAAGQAPILTPQPAPGQPAPVTGVSQAPIQPPVQPQVQPGVMPPQQPAFDPAAPQFAPFQDGDLSAILDARRQHASMIDERIAVLVGAFVQEGLDALARDDYASAYGSFANAYELDPDDPAARDLLARTGALIGKPGPSLMAIADSARDKTAATVDQTRVLIDQNRALGDQAMAAGDPDAALRHYEDAMALLRSSPGAVDDGSGEAELASRLAVARRAAADARNANSAELMNRAMEQQQLFDDAEANRVALRIDQLKQNADTAFLANDFAGAEEALAAVLQLDPNEAEALNLKRIAARARHDDADRVTRLLYRTQWQDTFDMLEQEMVPQNDLVLFPDADDWAVISARGSKGFAGEVGGGKPIDRAVAERLETAIPVNFADQTLEDVISHLSAVTGVNFLLSQDVQDEYTGDPYDLQDRAAQPVSRILKQLLEDLSLPPMTYTIRDGVVRIITQDEARSDYVLEMYDIRDLTFTPQDYAAQDFNLLPSGTDKDSFQDGVEDDEPLPFIGADALLTLIQDNIAPDSWTDDPERTIQLMPGTLVVRQTPDVHSQISELLDDLRSNTNTMIHIETRFIEVEDSFLEDIGVDLRGLDGSLTGNFPLDDFGQSGAGGFGTPSNPTGIGTGNDPGFFYTGKNGDLKGRIENLYDFTLGEKGTLNSAGGLSLQALFLDDTNVEVVLRAVTKYQTSNVVNAPNLMLRSGQRGNVKALTTRTYVRDFEPEIAQAAVIAQPELDNVKNGVMLDVRAVASADRRFITLELRPTVIDLVPDENGEDLPQEVVSLGTQNSSDVTIELPELRIQRLRTTATIPDGATLMLGGLKTSIEQDFHSGVPFLSDIPVLGALFSRQGDYTSRRKLIILLKARIIAFEEMEPSLGFTR